MKTIGIIGLGSFGYAILNHLSKKNKYRLLGSDSSKQLIEFIRKNRYSPIHGKKYPLKENNIELLRSIKELIQKSDIIILCISSVHIKDAIKNLISATKPIAGNTKKKILVNTSKALDTRSGKTTYETLSKKFHEKFTYVKISGGTIAQEILKEKNLALDVASSNKESSKEIAAMLKTRNLKTNPLADIIGTELAGAYKNVVSLYAGFLDGKNVGNKQKAEMLAELMKELKELATENGARKQTFTKNRPCWGQDIKTSINGQTRDHEYGCLLGEKNKKAKQYKKTHLLEGLNTLTAIKTNAGKYPAIENTKKIFIKSNS